MAPCYATFRNILTAHALKRLFRTFRSKIWPAICTGDLDFLQA